MNQRNMFAWGCALLILGILACFIPTAIVANTHINAIFFALMGENLPMKRFQKLQCPYFVNLGENSTIEATFRNPTMDAINYSMGLKSDGVRIDPLTSMLFVTVQGGQLAKVRLTVTAIDPGAQMVVIEASSNKDVRTDDISPFYARPTSFGGGCGILVIYGPLSGPQILFLGLVSAIIGGALLVTWRSRRIKQRKNSEEQGSGGLRQS
jgi:hypothetical protein